MKHLALLLLIIALPSHAFEQCRTRTVGGGFINELCKFEDSEQWARFIYHPDDENTQLVFEHQGWPASSYCDPATTSDAGGKRGETIIRLCSENFPELANPHDKTSGPYMGKNPYGDRMLKAAEKMNAERPIDINAGICNRGHSQGGRASMLQSMIAPNPYFRALFTCTNATEGWPLITRKPDGLYWTDPTVRQSWGRYPLIRANVHWQMALGDYKTRLTKLYGSRTSNLGKTDPYFFQLCDQYKVPCWGAWHEGDHTDEPGVFDGDNRYIRTAQWPGDFHFIRLDRVVPVFTASTANHFGQKGHYNLGLSAVFVPFYTTDKADLFRITLTYQAHTLLGGGIPDQPTEATFTLTLRNIQHFQHQGTLNWTMGSQSGTVERTGKEITIEGLTLESGKALPLVIRPEPQTFGLLYSRQPYYDKGHSDEFGTVGSAAPWQTRTNGGARQKTTTEYDLVLDRRDGSKPRVLFDCIGKRCAAGDARPDHKAERAIFSVMNGKTDRRVKVWSGPFTDMREFHASSCNLWVWEARTGQKWQIPGSEGECRRWPRFVTDPDGKDRIVYGSDVDGWWPPLAYNGNRFHDSTFQLYTAVIEDRELVDIQRIADHEWAITNPEPFSDGEVWYTAWHAAWPKKIPSPLNGQRLSGTSGHDFLNAHGAPPLRAVYHLRGIVDPKRPGVGSTPILIPRPVSEITIPTKDKPGKFAVGSYYRDNHLDGAGDIIVCDQLPLRVEGALRSADIPEADSKSTIPGSGKYLNSTCRLGVVYGLGMDQNDPRFDKDGIAMGSAGQPFPTPEGEFGYTHYTGHPYFALPIEKANEDFMGGPVARAYPVLAKVPMVTNARDTSQVEPLACFPENDFNCFDAYPFVSYQDLHGIPAPAPIKLSYGAGKAALAVVDAFKGEFLPIPGGFPGLTESEAKTAFQGNFNLDRYPRDLHAIRIETYDHWPGIPIRKGLYNLRLLKDCPVNLDGSVFCELPPGKRFLMSGITEDGTKIAEDLRGHSLFPGEIRCCFGCHDGHSEDRAKQLGDCMTEFAKTEAGK